MGKINIFEKQNSSMVGTLEGQKIMVYGGNDTGKTFQTTRLEKPMLLMAEAGGNARNVPKFPLDDWDDFTQIVKQLVSKYEEAREMYQTIIIDTTEMLVSLCEQKVAKIYGVMDVSMVQDAQKGNPNGYSLARTMFKTQINLLARHGNLRLVAGAAIERRSRRPRRNQQYVAKRQTCGNHAGNHTRPCGEKAAAARGRKRDAVFPAARLMAGCAKA